MVKFKFSNKKKFLIAEAGINHNGKLKTALDLVDTAKTNGADAIKFQTYKTEKRINKKYKKIFEILKNCELGYEDFKKINDYCKKKKIIFFSTPFDKEAVDFLETLKVPLYKVASFDISNYDLLKKIIATKKTTIVSTGMANMLEIKKVYKFFRSHKVQLSLLHCVSSYPTKEEDSYLSNIKYLINKFNCNIGISDHTNGIKIPIYGSLLGANIIEKHIKIDKKHKCIDGPVSITGEQLGKLRSEIDKMHLILNEPSFGIKLAEKNAKIFKRKKIY